MIHMNLVNGKSMDMAVKPKAELRARVGRKLVEVPSPPPPPPPSSNFITGRPKAALLFWFFWFFGDFTCGVPLFIVILVIYKYKNR